MMANVTIEQANYIMAYYSRLLTSIEAKALRHYLSTLKLEGAEDDRLKKNVSQNGLDEYQP